MPTKLEHFFNTPEAGLLILFGRSRLDTTARYSRPGNEDLKNAAEKIS